MRQLYNMLQCKWVSMRLKKNFLYFNIYFWEIIQYWTVSYNEIQATLIQLKYWIVIFQWSFFHSAYFCVILCHFKILLSAFSCMISIKDVNKLHYYYCFHVCQELVSLWGRTAGILLFTFHKSPYGSEHYNNNYFFALKHSIYFPEN